MTAHIEVLMPDYFDPTKLVIRKAQAADRHGEDLAEIRSERAVKRLGRRKLGKEPRATTEALSGRAQRKAARDYAEEWWQAIRCWEIRTFSDLVFPDSGSHTSGAYFEPITMGRSSNGNMCGDVLYTHVLTPIGWVSENTLGKELGHYPELERLHHGGGLASLIHPNGRGWNNENAPAYAGAVLKLAVGLGDEIAAAHLAVLQFVQVSDTVLID